jgi:hypothetical protein
MPKYTIGIESRKVIENKLKIKTSQLVMVIFTWGPIAKTTLNIRCIVFNFDVCLNMLHLEFLIRQ